MTCKGQDYIAISHLVGGAGEAERALDFSAFLGFFAGEVSFEVSFEGEAVRFVAAAFDFAGAFAAL